MTQRRSRGDGSLEERSPGRWRLRVYAGTGIDGRPLQTSKTVTARNRSDALRQLRQFALETAEDRARRQSAARRTVSDLLDEWLGHLARTGRADGTVASYGLISRRHIIPAIGATPLVKVGGHTLDSYYASRALPPPSGPGLGPNTIRVHHAVMSSAFAQAVKWGWLDRNPAVMATPPAKQPTGREAPSALAVRALIEACSASPELAMAVTVGALTGARRGELCGLRWSDVDWERATLRVARQRVPAAGGDVTAPTKTRRERVVALGPAGLAVLSRYRAMVEERAEVIGVDVPADGWLISPDVGVAPIRAKWLGESIAAVSERTGNRMTAHLLRYFAATQMVGAGVDVRTAAGRLGHNPEIMLRVYSSFVPSRDRDAAAGLERLVLEPPP